ncbi:hypothetical protein GHK86_05515 [Acidimicrobiaceae bacterium USS-CC1]|uniref:Uncharacterized protein n=1 Tax=Acidiferrimicrobium australe TaxID=2664430 RepID=A0ABW9QUW8_9ACTN|nr:hypothetical protein [Acidiferrimicrobium australe]
MPALQRAIGNRAVVDLLGGGANRGERLHSVDATRIQRFSFQDRPVPDFSGATITRSAAGKRGVFFAAAGGSTVVIKLDDEAAAPTETANILIKKLGGIETPDARAITDKKSPEWRSVKTAIQQKVGDDSEGLEQGRESTPRMLGNAKAIWLMPELKALSFAQLVSDRRYHTTLMSALRNEETMRQIGRLAVIDGFLGNWDRFLVPGKIANIGNIMLSEDGKNLVAIDSTVSRLKAIAFTEIDAQQQPDEEKRRRGNQAREKNAVKDKITFLQSVIDDQDAWIRGFFRTLIGISEQNAGAPLPPLLKEGGALAGFWKKAEQNIKAGLIEQQAVLAKAVKKNGKVKGVLEEKNVGDYETAKVSGKYAALRARGLSHEEAEEELRSYRGYRAKRGALPTGLKWTAKSGRG